MKSQFDSTATMPDYFDVICYFDTVAALLPEKPPNYFFQQIKNCGPKKAHLNRSRHPFLKWRLSFDQPSDDQLNALRQILNISPTSIMHEVHVAFDFYTKNTICAMRLTDWFNQRLVIPWPSKTGVWWYKTTRYTKRRRWRVSRVASYGDKLSKMKPLPCAHIELRASGHQFVIRHGLDTPIKLMNLNAQDFWEKNIDFKEIDIRALGRQALHRGRAKKKLIERWGQFQYDTEYRIGSTITQWAGIETKEPYPTAQAVQVACKPFLWFDQRSALRQINAGNLVRGVIRNTK